MTGLFIYSLLGFIFEVLSILIAAYGIFALLLGVSGIALSFWRTHLFTAEEISTFRSSMIETTVVGLLVCAVAGIYPIVMYFLEA